LHPAKKFYPQEQSPIAYVDYRLGLREDVYLVLGDFARDGSQATIRLQVNRLVSWIWIGGLILTFGTVLALVPERRRNILAAASAGSCRLPRCPRCISSPTASAPILVNFTRWLP